MTSRDGGAARPAGAEARRRPEQQLPPPANGSSKPLTPFGIEDILSRPSSGKRSYTLCVSSSSSSSSTSSTIITSSATSASSSPCSAAGKLPSAARGGLAGRALLAHTSPLCALEELASKTFKGLEVSVLQAAEGRDGLTLFGQRNAPKKRRKSRTAFTNHQIFELEKRFLYQKYLSPADRDQIAQQLGLTNAQVITWFQNRRAKLKRDLEEMKADVESAKSVGTVAFEKLAKLAELEKCAANGASPPGACCGELDAGSPPRENREDQDNLSPSTPALSPHAGPLSGRCCSEDEDEEIDVDD